MKSSSSSATADDKEFMLAFDGEAFKIAKIDSSVLNMTFHMSSSSNGVVKGNSSIGGDTRPVIDKLTDAQTLKLVKKRQRTATAAGIAASTSSSVGGTGSGASLQCTVMSSSCVDEPTVPVSVATHYEITESTYEPPNKVRTINSNSSINDNGGDNNINDGNNVSVSAAVTASISST